MTQLLCLQFQCLISTQSKVPPHPRPHTPAVPTANSDQHQFSPNNSHTLSRDKMITKEKMPRFFLSNSLYSIFTEMYRDQFGEFVCGYWGSKS